LIEQYNLNCNKVLNILEELKLDEDIKNLFQHLLAIGNYMNGTGNKGGAYGFKLDILAKISEIKSP